MSTHDAMTLGSNTMKSGEGQIRKIIEGMTQPLQAPSATLTRRFVRLLANPELVDQTYTACLERCRDEGSDVMLCGTLLLRQYLQLNPPSLSICQAILIFVREMAQVSDSSAVTRSLHNLENAVVSHCEALTGSDAIKWKQHHEEVAGSISRCSSKGSLHSSLSVISHNTPRAHSSMTMRGGRARRTIQDSHAIAGPCSRSTLEIEGYSYLPPFIGSGWKAASRPSADADDQLTSTINTHTDQIDDIDNNSTIANNISYAGASVDSSSYEQLLRGVLASRSVKETNLKQQEAINSYLGKLGAKAKRKGEAPLSRRLFQFHYYKEQSPLNMPREDIDKIITNLSSVPSSISGMGPSIEENELSQKIMIKVLCDSFASQIKTDSMESVRLTTFVTHSVIHKLVSSPYICVRRIAFSILLNLSVHINLLDNQNFFSENGNQNARKNVSIVHNELVWIIHEVLLQLVQWDEEDDSVWRHACICWMTLTTDPLHGFPSSKVLAEVDIRALQRFTTLASITADENVLGVLVKIIYSAMVIHNKLDSAKLESFGGWRAVVDLYLQVHTWSGRFYCFQLIYLHTAEQMMAHNELRTIVPPDQERLVLDNVAQELVRSDLHWYLVNLFRYPLELVNLSHYLISEGPMREGYNRHVVQSVMQHLQNLSLEYNKLPKCIRDDIRGMLDEPDRIPASLSQIKSLAQTNGECRSVDVENRNIASGWLFALTKLSIESSSQTAGISTLRAQIEGTLNELVQDRSWQTRLVFLTVTEAYLLAVRSKEPDATVVVDNLFKHLKVVLQRTETQPQVLLKAFYIIVDTIGLFVKELPTLQPRADSVADMLIGGAFEIPNVLLMKVRVNQMMLLFNGLLRCGSRFPGVLKPAHATLLIIIAVLSHDSSKIEQVSGGKKFFVGLLDEEYAPIALTAATFLCSHLPGTEPGIWKQAFSAADADALANPYLLARHVLNHSKSRSSNHSHPLVQERD